MEILKWIIYILGFVFLFWSGDIHRDSKSEIKFLSKYWIFQAILIIIGVTLIHISNVLNEIVKKNLL